jgi:hypothetical protein
MHRLSRSPSIDGKRGVKRGKKMSLTPLVIFCKSYLGDVDRCALLAKSYLIHCKDMNLKLYISTPQADQTIFKEKIESGNGRIQFVTDEQILGRNLNDSWFTQQLVKLNFFRLNIAENYFWIDSDYIFIKDFSSSDFFAYPGVPYFVCTNFSSPDIISWKFTVETQGKKFRDMVEYVRQRVRAIQQKFGRVGHQYSFGPPIWNRSVLENFDRQLSSQGISFDHLIAEIPFEGHWYGEFALASRIIPIIPHSGFAYHITTDEQANFLSAIGINRDKLAAYGYIAVTFATKWNTINPEEWV